MTTIDQAQAPKPTFFKKVQTGGVIMSGVGAAILAAPVKLSPFLLKLAAFFTVAGSITSAISQITNAAQPAKTDANGG